MCRLIFKNFNFFNLVPVHKASRARLQQGATENAYIILRAIARMRVVSKFFRALEFQGCLVSASSCTSRSIPLAA